MKDTLFFCELPFKWLGANAYFHRDGKGGPLHMTVTRKPFSKTATFSFANETELVLEPRAYLGFSRDSHFKYKEHRYRWSGSAKLKREDGTVMARFDRLYFAYGRDGRLEIYEQGKQMIDVIVATVMVGLCRGYDEEKG